MIDENEQEWMGEEPPWKKPARQTIAELRKAGASDDSIERIVVALSDAAYDAEYPSRDRESFDDATDSLLDTFEQLRIELEKCEQMWQRPDVTVAIAECRKAMASVCSAMGAIHGNTAAAYRFIAHK